MPRKAAFPGSRLAAVAFSGDFNDLQNKPSWDGEQMVVAPRSGFPIANGDYVLAQSQIGVVMNTPGATCTLPSYDDFQKGFDYGVKNGTLQPQTVAAAAGESILVMGQLVQSIVLPPDFSRQFTRETTTLHWIIT